jgi:hypothetical protein
VQNSWLSAAKQLTLTSWCRFIYVSWSLRLASFTPLASSGRQWWSDHCGEAHRLPYSKSQNYS